LILILCGITFFWFQSDFIFNHDSGYNDISNEFRLTFYNWNDFNAPGTVENRRFLFNFGYIFEYKILSLLFSYPTSQRIMFYLWMLSSWLGVYFLCRVIKLKKSMAFMAGGLYTFNIIALINIFSFGSGTISQAYIFTPIIIALFIKGVNENKNFLYALILSFIWLFGFSVSYVNPVCTATIFGFCFCYLLFNLFTSKINKKIFYKRIRFFMFFILTFLLINLFWIPSFFLESKSEISTAFRYINEDTARDKIIRESYEPTRLFNLMGFWALFDKSPFEGNPLWYQFSPFYKNRLILLISYLLPILVFSACLFKREEKRDILIFWYISTIICITFIGAARMQGISEYFLRFMELSSFISTGYRNVLTKFAPMLMMGYSILFAFSIDSIASKFKHNSFRKMIIPLLGFIVFIVILPLPLWQGEQFRENDTILPSSHVKIPGYYREAKEFLDNEKMEYNIAALPVITAAHIQLDWRQGYSGSSPFSHLLLKPILGKNTGPAYDPYLKIGSLIEHVTNKEQIPIFLSFYNAKYVIFLKDIHWKIGKNHQYTIPNKIEILEDFFIRYNKSLENLKEIGKLEIYKLKSDYFLPVIYTPQNILLVENFEKIPDNLSQLDHRLAVFFENQVIKNIERLNQIDKYTAKVVESSEIELINPSFESGLWGKKPRDCSNGMSGEPMINMLLSTDSTDGQYSLELSSKNHYSCTSISMPVNLTPGKKYKYSFDYKNVRGKRIDYYYNLIGIKKYPVGNSFEVNNSNWNHFETIIEPKEKITRIDFYFYAPSDGSSEVINRFDNLKLVPIDIELIHEENEYIRTPIMEFKKINPVKYRIKVHNASSIFPLVFSKSYHKQWKTYLLKREEAEVNVNMIDKYKILNGNEQDQASKEQIIEYVQNGWVSSLGDGKERYIKHKKWNNNIEILDYIEKYKIDFISEKLKGTIQNDNLPHGTFYETWLQKPIINESNHLTANGYANSWIIDPQEICSENPDKCTENPNGTYDFELVIEFWPQRLFYIGLFILGITLCSCIIYLIYYFKKRKETRNITKQ